MLFVAALLVPAIPATAKAPRVEVTCSACVLVDDTGRELFARSASTPLANASTTKMTTALVVRAETSLEAAVLVSATAATAGGGGLDLHQGEVFTVRALLYALLLDSSNDAAVALAEHVAGSEKAFVEQMNRYVAAAGATDTHYVTAHGLDMPGHRSTARDLALIAAELLDDPALARIVASPRASIEGPAGTIVLENRNVLLEAYRGATGVKTGFTSDAGNVLVASATRGGRRLIAVAMRSVDAADDARALLDLGWMRLERTIVLRAGTPVGELVFDDGATPVVSAASVRDGAFPDDVTFEFLPDDDVAVPLEAGDVVGQVVVSSPHGPIEVIDAIAVRDVVVDPTGWVVDLFAGLLRELGALMDLSA